MNKLAKCVYLTHFPFGVGCSGVANISLLTGLLLTEKKPSILDPKFWAQIYKPGMFIFVKHT